MADEKNTAIAGAEPESKETNTATLTGAEPVKDAKTDSSTENVPFDKDPRWKAARQAEKKLQELLKMNGLEDPDDLEDLVNRGKVVKGKLKDLQDLDELIKDAEEIRKYRPLWKEQEERRRREVEDPDQTIARLERELKNKDAATRQKEEQKRQAEAAREAIQSFERDVKEIVREMEIPKEQQGFVLEFFGVGNPANDIDISDKRAVKRMVAEGIRKKEAYDQSIIKAYIDGKINIPKVGSASSTAAPEEKPKIKNLKEARSIFLETMQKASGG